MCLEGELQKRKEALRKTISEKSSSESPSFYEGYELGLDDFMEIIEWAKKEFPYTIGKEGYFHLKPEFATAHNSGKQMVELIQEWFVKWFSE